MTSPFALAALALTAAVFLQHEAAAQTPARTMRIGILSSGTPELRGHLEKSLLDRLREQGYVEGQNLQVERRYGGALGRSAVIDHAKELAAMKLDAVVTTCTPSTTIAKQAMQSTPIVMAAVSDPVGQGLITSLARPGGNITGVSSQGKELLPKMLEHFARVLPKGTRVAVLANANNAVHAEMWRKMSEPRESRPHGLSLMRVEIASSADLAKSFETIARDGARALFVLGDDPLMLNLRERIVLLAAVNRLPDFYWAREFVDAGGLMSYGESLRSDYRDAATYLTRLAGGARPGDLPVQQPRAFELVINRKTALALGLVLPPDLLAAANEIIE